jgi:hypothetical protein
MKTSYNCAQEELYTVARLAWRSCLDYLQDFSGFRAIYTAQFVQNKLREVEDAANLPNWMARNTAAESLRIKMVELVPKCLKAFGYLKRYIVSAYPLNLQKTKMDSAGHNFYEKAAAFNWESMQGLLQNALNFVQTNVVDLMLNDNMPTSYPADLQGVRDIYQGYYQDFLSATEDAVIATQEKIIANNELYASLSVMLGDGQVVFSDDEAVVRQFVFSTLLETSSGVSTAGLKGNITDSVTGRQIVGAKIGLQYKDKSTVTDNEGYYQINQVAAGTYTIIVVAEGYQDFIKENHEVKVGTVSNVHIALDKEV